MKRRVLFALVAGISSLSFGLPAPDFPEAPKAPMAKKIGKTQTLHGEDRRDEYDWLRERKSPEVRAYLDAENAYTDGVMKDTAALQKKLYDEMLGRIKETDLSVPYRKGDYFYYSRTEEGKQYSIYCRKHGSLEAPEEVTIDLNELARGERFMARGDYEVSDDGKLLAYTLDNTGFREYTLHVRNLVTGKVGPENIPRVSSIAWAADNKTLFYVVDDEAKRPYRLYRHAVGSTEPDTLVYEEKDAMFTLGVERSRSGAFVFLESSSHTSSEWQFLAAKEPAGSFRMVAPREKEHQYDVDHHGDLFYIRTNRGCRNFGVATTSVASPGKALWKDVFPCREDVMVSRISLFAGHAVYLEREDGVPRVRVTDLRSGASHRVDFPETVYALSPEVNAEFDTAKFRFNYQSLTTPSTVYEYDMGTKARALLKRTEVLGGYDPARYRTERIFATAPDGARVPVSLVYRKGLVRDGKNPTLLNGYGSYGVASFPTFSSGRVSLLDRGFVFAIAHIRGGGEMGKKWHDQGKMLSKKNTFTDFIAAADALIAQKYTSPEKLAIEGGSAGGLLMGAVVNMRPDLFKAVIARVPFVDVINTMLDESLPLTVGEFEEWGNPKVKEQYDYMKSYSPYDNLSARAYPSMLVKTSFDDSQVMYWEPAKYVARLRAVKTDSNPLLFKINMAGGHGGSSGRYDRIREAAFDYAFLFKTLGVS
ncbi:MAG: S9 family peptidase [Thermoanaerobaculia bacterium]|nr:S9 family peptidase [Acidobacteriota bacterium]